MIKGIGFTDRFKSTSYECEQVITFLCFNFFLCKIDLIIVNIT